MHVRDQKIFVGLSGGVDSGVSAALLQKAGAKVTGVFIKGWYPPGMPCTWAQDRRDAMRVAARLGIPFLTLDASAEYKKGVIDYLLSEYAQGRTPNPDVMCNREVKFGAFYDYAKKQGADLIATGHYAQTREVDGEIQLLRGKDAGKDQSYFLWAVPKSVLSETLFPVGGLEKREVRALAERFNLPNARKKDSQGICFLGSISVEDFLKEELGSEAGIAIDTEGNEVGRHDGATLHTLGERVRLTGAPPGPWYVVQKDMRENILTVSKEPKQEETLQGIALTETNWLIDQVGGEFEAQYRYHGPIIMGNITDDTFTPAAIAEPLAPGQSLVLYRGERCFGGGIML